MDFGQNYKFYDPNYAEHPRHNHIICQDCEKIVEFESEQLDDLEKEISHRLGFSTKTHRLQITPIARNFKNWARARRRENEVRRPDPTDRYT